MSYDLVLVRLAPGGSLDAALEAEDVRPDAEQRAELERLADAITTAVDPMIGPAQDESDAEAVTRFFAPVGLALRLTADRGEVEVPYWQDGDNQVALAGQLLLLARTAQAHGWVVFDAQTGALVGPDVTPGAMAAVYERGRAVVRDRPR